MKISGALQTLRESRRTDCDLIRVVSTLYYKLTVFVQRLTSEDTEALLQRDKL